MCLPLSSPQALLTMDTTQNPHRVSGTFEFFPYRGTFGCASAADSEAPSGDAPVVASTAAQDPVTRLTRECNTLRLRLATAERASRPHGDCAQGGIQSDGISAPPSSARTPPVLGLNLAVPLQKANSRPSSLVGGSFTYTYQVPIQAQQNQIPPQTVSPPTQLGQPTATKRNSQNRNQRRRNPPATPPTPPQQQQVQQKNGKNSQPSRQPNNNPLMRAAERCKQLERSMREVEELLRDRDREVAELKKERDRLLAERERDRRIMREKEQQRAHERSLEQAREREREQEREQERQREEQRRKEREAEKERERERRQEREREQEERQRRLSHSASERNFRRARSQTPVSPTHAPYPNGSHVDVEQLAHMRSLDVFLTKTDGWSGAQVIQAVDDLNTEITQFAASATEVCIFERNIAPTSYRRSRQSRRGRGGHFGSVDGRTVDGSLMTPDTAAELAPWLGDSFARILAMRDHEQDPVLVQLALQASLATCCARSLSLFCVGFPSKLDGLLSRVFSHMQLAGASCISLYAPLTDNALQNPSRRPLAGARSRIAPSGLYIRAWRTTPSQSSLPQ